MYYRIMVDKNFTFSHVLFFSAQFPFPGQFYNSLLFSLICSVCFFLSPLIARTAIQILYSFIHLFLKYFPIVYFSIVYEINFSFSFPPSHTQRRAM